MSTTWNYRVIEFLSADERYIEIREVYYDENGMPAAYAGGAAAVGGTEGVAELGRVLDRLREALEKPMLKQADFPQHDSHVLSSMPEVGDDADFGR